MSGQGCSCAEVGKVCDLVQDALDLVEDGYRQDSMLLSEVRSRLRRAVLAAGELRTGCSCRVAS